MHCSDDYCLLLLLSFWFLLSPINPLFYGIGKNADVTAIIGVVEYCFVVLLFCWFEMFVQDLTPSRVCHLGVFLLLFCYLTPLFSLEKFNFFSFHPFLMVLGFGGVSESMVLVREFGGKRCVFWFYFGFVWLFCFDFFLF